MVFGIFAGLSVLCGLLTCVSAGAFGGLQWIWMLPVSALGSFVGLLVLVFTMLLIMAAPVKMNEPQEKDSPFYRWVILRLADLLIPLLGIRIHQQGFEKAPKEGRFLLVCNHLNDIDPVVLLRALPKSTLAFISKRENDQKFLIGPFLHKIMCQPINRENDREALKTILKCIDMIKTDTASVGVFPEGYVSLDGKLHPMRSGVFKIALRAQVPVVVCTLRNTQYALKNAKKLKKTEIHLHLVDVIPAQKLQGMTAVELGTMVHDMMAKDLGPELVLQQ